MKNRVALYIRVSTEEQAKEGFSLEAQEATLIEYCNNRGYNIVGKYIDDGKVERTLIAQHCRNL